MDQTVRERERERENLRTRVRTAPVNIVIYVNKMVFLITFHLNYYFHIISRPDITVFDVGSFLS